MAWCFEDQSDDYTELVLNALEEHQALVPAIWALEVANVLATAERRGRLTVADSKRFLDLLGDLPILVEELTFERASGPVLEAAREFRLSAYDAAYLELAMRTASPLATRDEALLAACRKSGAEVFGPGGAL